MSSDKRLTEALAAAFTNQQAVFWHDVDQAFTAMLPHMNLGEQVEIVQLDKRAALHVKLDVEADLAAGGQRRWLFYSNQPEPEPAKDWLLDIRLRAKTFRADSTSMLLEELGLGSLTLAPHLKLRSKFLRAKDRVERLKRLVSPSDDAEALDRKMIAVLLRSDESDVLALAMHVLKDLPLSGGVLGHVPKSWSEIVANELDSAFWLMMARHLGYQEATPSLPDLLVRMLVTDLVRNLRGPCPPELVHLVLPDKVLAANASVLAGRWRSDLHGHASYAELSAVIAQTLALSTRLAAQSPEILAEAMTFAVLDQLIIAALKARVISQGGAALEGVRALAGRRRDGPWVSRLLASTSDSTRALGACYDAVEAAAEFLALKERHAQGLSFASAADAVERYRHELFKFDQLYRRVHHAAAQVEPMGWGLLHELRDGVESAYAGWFMPQLALAWDKVLAAPEGLLQTWALASAAPQQRFFEDRVAGGLRGSIKRVFVIISDALRYEAAEELGRQINSKNRLVAQLDVMLGVLPSYTSLGMAALLPHKTLAYRGTEVWADDQPTASLEARDALLAQHGGMAIKADELLALGRVKGRERIRDQRVVYVYHDRIDMLGDKQVSEGQTFDAVAETINELQSLVRFVIDTLNGTLVMVTADHGFIYQESALDEADKAVLGDKPEGTLKAKKRYLLGRDLPETTKAWRGHTAITAGTTPGESSLDFWVPKGTMRFHFTGGARFVHGSAMPQEVLIPVLSVRESEAASAKTRMVDLRLIGSSNRVVTNKQRFEFIQNEAVSERVLARTVLISLRDGPDLISDEQTLTFDSSSDQMNDWIRSVFLTVRAGSYDRLHDYHLVVRDAQSQVEVMQRSAVRIDLAFSNDF